MTLQRDMRGTVLAALRGPLRRTWAGMLAERLVRAFWPLWTLLLVAWTLGAFGAHLYLPGMAMTALTAIWAVVSLWALLRGLWRFSLPTRSEALERIDLALPYRPISALVDVQAQGANNPASVRLWQAHLARMAARAAVAGAVRPDLRLAARDPFALRYVALTGLVMALLFGAPQQVGEALRAAAPGPRAEAMAHGPSWEAWIQPPPYTGRPSLYLNEVARPQLSIPQGSRISARFYGQAGVMTLVESLSGRTESDPAEPAHEFLAERSGRLSIRGPAGRDWEIVVEPDTAPSIRLVGEMERERGGLMRQEFTVRDDYGVVAGEALIELDEAALDRRHGLAMAPDPREAIRLDIPLPLTGSRAEFSENLIEDLSKHPWANLPVRIRLSAEDAQGQIGESDEAAALLPGRRFFDPMAAALIEMRRDLLWSLENAPRTVQVMRAISHRPEDAFRNERAYLRLRVLLRQIEAAAQKGLTPETRDALAEDLWELAVLLEEGDLADAAERLRRAQERLSEAMRNGADPAEIAELMDELREATRDYIRQLAEQPRERDSQQADSGERMEITGDQLQELMDRIQELMEEGRMAEAAELMEQLAQLLQNLQVAEGGEGGEGMPGAEGMQGLGETLRRQQELADDTFRSLQDRFGGSSPGEEQGEGGSGDSLADRQQQLRDELRETLREPLPGAESDAGDAARDSFDQADRAMEQAEDALRDGDAGRALDRQAEAMEAMRQGLRGLNEALAQEMRERQGREGTAMGEGGTDGTRDPLGRDTTALGRIGTEADMLQGSDTYRRARDLLDEIRRRSAEQERPMLELDYLRRLLERF